MIIYYFDTNARAIVQAPGNPQPVASQTWVFNDVYTLKVYICNGGNIQPINPGDTLEAIFLFQPTAPPPPPPVPPEQNLITNGQITIGTDPVLPGSIVGNYTIKGTVANNASLPTTGNTVGDVWMANDTAHGWQWSLSLAWVDVGPVSTKFFTFNVFLNTVALAAVVQTPYKPATCHFHLVFSPNPTTDPEVFSSSLDIVTTVNPDPTKNAVGTVSTPPGYPQYPPTGILEMVANKGAVNGYAPLDGGARVPIANLPVATLPAAPGINYPVDGITIGVTNNTLKVISAGGNGDMLQANYDTGAIAAGAATHIIAKAQQVMVGAVPATPGSGTASICGTAATFNVPPSGNAVTGQVVLGSDTRLSTADGITIIRSGGGVISARQATPGVSGVGLTGIVQPDGSTITETGAGIISVPVASNTTPGIVQPDNSTITITGGIIRAAAGVPISNVRVHATTAGQTISQTIAAVTFQVLDFQNGGIWWTSGAPTELIIPVTGIYQIGGNVTFNGSAAPTTALILVLALGATISTATFIAQVTLPIGSAGAFNPAGYISTIYSFTANQIIQLGVFMAGNGASSVLITNGTPNFWANRIG